MSEDAATAVQQMQRKLSLDLLTEQSRARRFRRLSEPIEVTWQEGILIFPLSGDQSGLVEEAWQVKNNRALLTALWGEDRAHKLMAKLKASELEGIWEMVGIEYEFQSAVGLVRMEQQYERWQEARKNQREMIGQSIEETPEPDPLTLPPDAAGND